MIAECGTHNTQSPVRVATATAVQTSPENHGGNCNIFNKIRGSCRALFVFLSLGAIAFAIYALLERNTEINVVMAIGLSGWVCFGICGLLPLYFPPQQTDRVNNLPTANASYVLAMAVPVQDV